VDPLLGGDAALRELLDAAHDRGIRVVLDGVFNHAGRGFFPFQHVLEAGLQSPYRDWFYLDPAVLAGARTIDAYRPRGDGGPEATGYRSWWNVPSMPKLRVEHPPAREFLLGVAEHWLRFGIDGWRRTCPATSTTRRSGRSSGGGSGRFARRVPSAALGRVAGVADR
jgi:glycosidase